MARARDDDSDDGGRESWLVFGFVLAGLCWAIAAWRFNHIFTDDPMVVVFVGIGILVCVLTLARFFWRAIRGDP